MINGPKVVIPPLGTLEWETVSKLLLALASRDKGDVRD